LGSVTIVYALDVPATKFLDVKVILSIILILILSNGLVVLIIIVILLFAF